MVKQLLRLEGLALFIASIYFFNDISGNWLLFVSFLLLPDISMLGYLRNKRVGAITYNLMHNYVISLAIILAGIFLFNNNFIASIGVILFAHVSIDRFFGYGLKYPTNFKDTHLEKI